MNKKLRVVLLLLTFMLGSVGFLGPKRALCNTGPDVALCAAEPWSGGWNKATPPPPPDPNSTYSSANSDRPGDKVEPQRVQQKPQKSFWSRLQFFLFNLNLLFGSK